jgi:hypothetical protein
MNREQQRRESVRKSAMGEVDARIQLTDAVARWADSVGLRQYGAAVCWRAWDDAVWAHADGGTPQEIAARIDEIVRSYGGTPQGAAPDDAPEDPPDPDYDGPMIPTGGA